MINRRTSGILLHISSLPSDYGIGDLGPNAHRFVHSLSESNQRYWQILPLNPTSVRNGNSPYSTDSAFAGNPLFISLDDLVDDGLLKKMDFKTIPSFPGKRVDYRNATRFKERLLSLTYERNKVSIKKDRNFRRFVRQHQWWLNDYALFKIFKKHFKKPSWALWPKEVRNRSHKALGHYSEKFESHIERVQFFQYLFFKQWHALKKHCHRNGIKVIGDIPIYVHYESCDVWIHPEVFKLDRNKRPTRVAGVPPDFFSANGQLWGNPIYRWDYMKKTQYRWWIDRLDHTLSLVDLVRLDHFKGFCDYWEVPASHKTARKGRWIKGPRNDFFRVIRKHFPSLPFIAEDLGEITPAVHALRDRFGLPGMRVLQFAFGNDPLADLYKPHNYIKNCVAYTGTHDNDTLAGWMAGKQDYSTRSSDELLKERNNALQYLASVCGNRDPLHWKLIRLLMSSSANTIIIPLQDLLGLGQEARMNRPARALGNWQWRFTKKQLVPKVLNKLLEMTRQYGRS
jgi:4-alpha-glucanotransferase